MSKGVASWFLWILKPYLSSYSSQVPSKSAVPCEKKIVKHAKVGSIGVMLPSPNFKLNSITCYATCLFCPLLFLANQLLTTFYYSTLQLRTGLDNHYRSRFLTLLLKLLVQLECQNWCHPKFNVMINRFSGILIRRKNHKSVK